MQVATGLRELILRLYDKHLSADGRAVSYGALRSDPQFREFVTATAELQKVRDWTGLWGRAVALASSERVHDCCVVPFAWRV